MTPRPDEALIAEARENLRGPLTLTWPQIERLHKTAQRLLDRLDSLTRPQDVEGVARIIDPEAWREFDEELHEIEHELDCAGIFPVKGKDAENLALDNVSSRRPRREVSLTKARAILALSAGGAGWGEPK